MKLRELKELLQANSEKQFLLQLPNAQQVPVSFHITEVGQINKTFIDCGGKVHSQQTCQLQAWVGPDEDHRIEAGKLASILEIARSIVPNDDIDIEIEYEDSVISQYPVQGATVSEDAVTLVLTTKHTDCLARELCIVPSSGGCGPVGCC
jgi:hypothetical protein